MARPTTGGASCGDDRPALRDTDERACRVGRASTRRDEGSTGCVTVAGTGTATAGPREPGWSFADGQLTSPGRWRRGRRA
jgi:hypothetical protein